MGFIIINDNPTICAMALDDALLNRKIIEVAQTLSVVIRDNPLVNNVPDNLYTICFVSKANKEWVASSNKNFRWAWLYLKALCDEYKYRFEETHKCEYVYLVAMNYEHYFPNEDFAPFIKDFSLKTNNYEELMETTNVFTAYKKYLTNEWNCGKNIKWTGRDKPVLFEGNNYGF